MRAGTVDGRHACHSGTATERGVNNGIGGNSRLAPTGGFDLFCGGINCWNILGPFAIGPVCSSGCAPTFEQLLSDIAAHDCRPDLKVAFLEKLGAQLGDLLERMESPLRVAVASDHATLSESGQHAADPLPILVWGHGVDADDVETFDEHSAAGGSMGRFPLPNLLWQLFGLG